MFTGGKPVFWARQRMDMPLWLQQVKAGQAALS
jgi:hypothetical protein